VLGLAVEQRYFSVPVDPQIHREVVRPQSRSKNWTLQASPIPVRSEHCSKVCEHCSKVCAGRERGAHLEAFFGCLYYAAMRPAEAVDPTASQCHTCAAASCTLAATGPTTVEPTRTVT
jgi:hypothetical protein